MKNIMLPTPHKILSVLKETQAEYTFRVEYEGETDHGQFFQLSIPKIGEAPISVSGKGDGYVEFTIRKIGRLTNGIFGLDVGDKDDHVGVVDGDLSLVAHEGQNHVVGAGLDTAGVHQNELAAGPLGLTVNAVTGYAGNVLYDGHTLTDQLVEKHGLTHVGAAHNGNHRFTHRINLLIGEYA